MTKRTIVTTYEYEDADTAARNLSMILAGDYGIGSECEPFEENGKTGIDVVTDDKDDDGNFMVHRMIQRDDIAVDRRSTAKSILNFGNWVQED